MLLKYKNISCRPYTLLEMLMVIVLISVLLNGALYFYNKGKKLSRQYENKAFEIKSTKAVKLYFRDFVKNNGATFIVRPDKVVFKNSHSIYMNKHQLIFDSDSNKKVITLPKSLAVSFGMEKHSGENPLLVLLLCQRGSKGQILTDKYTRIVAPVNPGGKVKK